MCLAVIAYRFHPNWPIVIVANRDEFHDRPSTAMHIWNSDPRILAGKDLRAGGTWLGLNERAQIALLTNVREPGRFAPDALSRGKLVESYLLGSEPASQFADMSMRSEADYNGYNLLLMDDREAFVISNRPHPNVTRLTPGIHGLSNASLNTPWPKLTRSTEAVRSLFHTLTDPDPQRLIEIMQDDLPPADPDIPQTGLTPEREKLLASPFIRSPEYGTRCTTTLMRHRSGKTIVQELRYQPDGSPFEHSEWMLSTEGVFSEQAFSQIQDLEHKLNE